MLLAVPALAQTAAPAALPPEAQALIKKGMIAAQEQEWLIAIQSFQDARKSAPESPVVFYNLGLAESKIPGRELRAIAWFGAYLAASPNAPNAAAVNDFIEALQIKNQGNINRLIKTAQSAATEPVHTSRLDAVALLWLESGDLAAALATVDLNHTASDSDNMASEKISALNNIARAQAKAGDMVGARKTFASALQAAELIQSAYIKGSSQQQTASYQTNAGDIAGALHTVAVTNYSGFADKVGPQSRSLARIAGAQAESGDSPGARETLSQALTLANSIHDPHDRASALEPIVEVQAKLGDIAAAKETLAAALNAVSGIENSELRPITARLVLQRYFDIAKAQLRARDFAGARESLAKYAASQPDPNEYMTKFVITSFQKEIDHAEANAAASNASASPVISATVAQAPVAAIKVRDWIGILDDDNASACPLNTKSFLDLAGYLAAQHSDDSSKLFDVLNGTADTIIKARNVIDQMLKQQAKQ